MKRIFLLLTFMMSFLQLKADEGMWLLTMIKRLNGVDMKKEGLKINFKPEDITISYNDTDDLREIKNRILNNRSF